MAKELYYTNVYGRVAEAYFNAIENNGPRLICLPGGQGSSKTYSILQVIYDIVDTQVPQHGTICSYALPHLKKGAISSFDKIVTDWGNDLKKVKNITDSIYKIKDSSIDCYGIEGNIALAHGPRRDFLFINEVNRKVSYEVFDQLFSRTAGVVFLDWNPDSSFWLQEKVLPGIPHVIIKSTFRDNPWIPQNELDNILLKKDKPQYANWWRVYGEGEEGLLEGAVIANWRYGKFDDSLPFGFGLDFGFHPDPDALVKVAIDSKLKRIYAKECFYIHGQSTDSLIKNVRECVNGNELIIADSSAPRYINDLDRAGLNIIETYKHHGSVIEGLRQLNDYELIIDEDDKNLETEVKNYVWSDKKAGIPIDAFQHLIDGIRYYISYILNYKRRGIRKAG